MSSQAIRNNKNTYLFKPFLGCGVVAAFSDRSADVGFSAGKNLRSNRRQFLKGLGIDYRDLVAAEQVHAAKIKLVGLKDKGKGALGSGNRLKGVDGFITDSSRLPLAVFTADCLPVFLLDPRRKAVGLVHAGWRGAQKKIVAKTVMMMKKKFASRSGDLLVGLGPCIRKCCYGVGRDFRQLFKSGLIKKYGKNHLDLIAVAVRQLKEAGIKKANIFDCGICTSCRNKRFFSFRKEGEKAGRMMAVIMIK